MMQLASFTFVPHPTRPKNQRRNVHYQRQQQQEEENPSSLPLFVHFLQIYIYIYISPPPSSFELLFVRIIRLSVAHALRALSILLFPVAVFTGSF